MKLTESSLRSLIKQQLQQVLEENVGESEVPYAARLIRDIREKFTGFNSVHDTFLNDFNKSRGISLEFNREQLDWLLSKLGTGDTVESLIAADRSSRGLKPSRYAIDAPAAGQDTYGSSRAMDESRKK